MGRLQLSDVTIHTENYCPFTQICALWSMQNNLNSKSPKEKSDYRSMILLRLERFYVLRVLKQVIHIIFIIQIKYV